MVSVHAGRVVHVQHDQRVPKGPSYKSGRDPEIDFWWNPRYGILVPRLVLIFSELSE